MSTSKIILAFTRCLVVFGCLIPCIGAADLDVVNILKRADRARGNMEGITWEVTVTSEDRGEKNEMAFDVKARGFDLKATYTAPAKHRGKLLLLSKGNMWFYKPGLSKPFPIARRQKLLGNAAYGDIAATNYAEDFNAELLPERQNVRDEACYVFNLTSRTGKTTYSHIRYWISVSRGVGMKAEYFTATGKLVKAAEMFYRTFGKEEGGLVIAEIKIADTLLSKQTTNIVFSEPDLTTIPDSTFSRALLRR